MFNWSRIWLIAKRELTVRFRQRSYRWTLLLQLVIAAVAALAPVGIAWFTDGDSDALSSVVVVDEAQVGVADRLAPYLQDDGGILPSIKVRTDAGSAEEARALVEDGDAGQALIVTRDSGDDAELAWELVTDDGTASSIDAQRVMSAVTAFSVEFMAEERGLSAEEAQGLVAMPEISVHSVSGEEGDASSSPMDFQSAEFSVAYFGSILIYIAIILYGTWIATGVAEEKGSRIMEIMVNAATPRDLLFGKVIGIMLAGLAQLVPMLMVGGTLFALQPRIAEAVDVSLPATMDIDLAQLSVKAVATFLVYFLFGFILYGGLYAGIGSMVSRQEEVNQAVSPMMTVIVIAFFVAVIVINVPDSLLARIMMIVPLTSPFVALPRILVGDPPAWEIALSVGLLIVTAIGSMWLASKLYRVGVLMYGQRPGWKSLLKVGRMQQVAR
jgi:ABC-2 type transport system permease protein